MFLRARACVCLCTCVCALETIAIAGGVKGGAAGGAGGQRRGLAVREGGQGRSLLFFVIKYHRDKLPRGVRVCASARVGVSPPPASCMHTGKRVCRCACAQAGGGGGMRESVKDGNGGGKVRRYMLKRVTNRGSLEDSGGASKLPLGIASFLVSSCGCLDARRHGVLLHQIPGGDHAVCGKSEARAGCVCFNARLFLTKETTCGRRRCGSCSSQRRRLAD